jgi:hypothetical protein
MGNQSEEKKEGERSRERMECLEAEFLNFYGVLKSISRNQFRQPMKPGGAGTITLFLLGS